MSLHRLKPGLGWGYGARDGGKCSRKRVENVHFDPCFLQNTPAFRTHRIFYRCNREIWRLSHVWLVVYIIAWTGSSAVLTIKQGISLAPHLTTISRVSSSVTYTLSRIPISLYYLLYLFFLLFYYILCFTSPAHPSALHLVYP